MDWFALLFGVVGVCCVLTTLVGLPGTWMMILLAVVIELADPMWLPQDAQISFGWGVILIGVLLASAGEVLELMAGALGVRIGKGTRRGMVGAFSGGLLGMILGTLFIPIPLLGTLVGTVFGTFAGAFAAEFSQLEPGEKAGGAVIPALTATLVRMLGGVGKCAIGVLVLGALVIAAWG